MATTDKDVSRSSVRDRVVLYATPAVTSVLLTIVFYQLALHQSHLHELERYMKQSLVTATLQQSKKDINLPDDDLHLRYTRNDKGTTDDASPLSDYINRIAEQQLRKLLKARCADNKLLCMQGSKGEKGDRGLVGSLGLKGVKGDKGDPGLVSDKIDPPVITKQPSDVLERETGTAEFNCAAKGFPTPQIRWVKLDSTLPRSRVTMSKNHSLTIRNIHHHDAGTYICLAENIFGVAKSYATLFIQVPINFSVIPPSIVTVQQGRNVRMQCLATGYPSPTITLSKSDDMLDPSKVTVNGSLVIASAKKEDAGQYTCTAKNSLEKKSYSFALKLQQPRNDLSTKLHGEIQVEMGDDVILKCNLCAIPGFSITWEKVEGKIATNRTNHTECSLTIRNVTRDDAGKYSCIARSKSWPSFAVLRQDIKLFTKAAPLVTSSNPSFLVLWPGENATLGCSGVGTPDPNVYWTKGPLRLKYDKNGFLRLVDVSHRDSGIYTCHAVNYLGKDSKSTALVVVTTLKFVDRPPASVVATSGDIVINCTAKLAPNIPATTKWILPPRQCGPENAKKTVLANGTLVIHKATAWDTTTLPYVCYAGDKRISTSVQLKVAVDTRWMLTADSCQGFRQSTYNSSVYYAVSASTKWDTSKYYHCPEGYYWACTEEGRRIFKSGSNSGSLVYSGKCGWNGYTFAGATRYYFRFRDSASTSAYKHTGNADQYQVQTSWSRSNFAGIVCIKV